MQTCMECGLEKDFSEFNRRSKNANGYNHRCRDCVSNYRKNRRDARREAGLPHENKTWQSANRDRLNAKRQENRHRRRDFIRDLKKDRPCADCGNTYPPMAMDFDHLPGEEKRWTVTAGAANLMSEEQLLAEAAKCDLVCANCHRIRTARRAGDPYFDSLN